MAFLAPGMTQPLPIQLRTAVRFLGRHPRRRDPRRGRRGGVQPDRGDPPGLRRLPPRGHAQAAKLMAERLGGLSLPETVRFAHSFACFLQITNIAEDQTQRRRGRAGDARGDTLAGALRSAEGARAWAPRRWSSCCAHALIAPVITAHPSEVRRKSVLDRRGAPSPTTSTPTTTPAREAERAAIERRADRARSRSSGAPGRCGR